MRRITRDRIQGQHKNSRLRLAVIVLSGVMLSGLIQSAVLVAQETDQSVSDGGLEAMQRLAPMVGEWEGEGWIRKGPNEPEQMRSTESVQFELNGRILVIRGLHFDKDDQSKVVHNAFAIVSYDSTNGKYQFRSFLADGRQGVYDLSIDDDGIIKWVMESPQGKIEYTITIKDDQWSEVGEMSGERKFQFFQMELKRAE